MSDRQLTAEESMEIAEANELTYRKLVDSCLVNTRQKRLYNFSPTSYTVSSSSSQAEIVCGSGGDYIYGPGSYLRFTIQAVKADGTTAADNAVRFGSQTSKGHSAANIFRSIEIQHRSGDQIDRVDNVNALAQILLPYANEQSYGEGYASSFGGWDPRNADSAGGYSSSPTGYQNLTTARTYCLPLWLLSGFFSQRQLIPGDLMGGLKITLTFDDFKNTCIDTGAASSATQWKITGMALVLDSFQLFDDIQRSLKAAASNVKTQGIKYNFDGWHNINKSTSNGSVNMDLNFSAAKVNQLVLKVRKTADLNLLTTNSLAGEPFDWTELQARLGSLTFPRHKLTSSAEAYNQTQQSFDADPVLDLTDVVKSSVGVSYGDYANIDGATSLATGSAGASGLTCVAWSMEKSNILKGSGELTNNSRLLNIEGTLGASDARRVDAWVKHMRCCNVMIDNIVVDK